MLTSGNLENTEKHNKTKLITSPQHGDTPPLHAAVRVSARNLDTSRALTDSFYFFSETRFLCVAQAGLKLRDPPAPAS